MSKKRVVIDVRQMTIFECLKPETPSAPGSLNIGIKMRHAISEAIRKSGKDRIDICADIYRKTGIEVPKSTLDSWSAESRDLANDQIDRNGNKRWGMPADLIPAFCEATGDDTPLLILTEARHYQPMKGREVIHAKIGQLKEKITREQQELKELERALLEGR